MVEGYPIGYWPIENFNTGIYKQIPSELFPLNSPPQQPAQSIPPTTSPRPVPTPGPEIITPNGCSRCYVKDIYGVCRFNVAYCSYGG